MKEYKEQLISFKIAKLAKKKGFKGIHRTYVYNEKGETFREFGLMNYPSEVFPNFCSAVTQSLLQKWIREVHDIDVYIIPNGSRNKTITKRLYHPQLWVKDEYQTELHSNYTYEEALEEGLYKALKLIKNDNKTN